MLVYFLPTLRRQSQMELESLTNLIESIWTHYKPPGSPSNLDLDTMFNFLRDEKGDLTDLEKKQALNVINQQFEDLDELWTQTENVSE